MEAFTAALDPSFHPGRVRRAVGGLHGPAGSPEGTVSAAHVEHLFRRLLQGFLSEGDGQLFSRLCETCTRRCISQAACKIIQQRFCSKLQMAAVLFGN